MSAFSFESQHDVATMDNDNNYHDTIESIADRDWVAQDHLGSNEGHDLNADDDLADAIAVMNLLVPDFDDSDTIHLTGDALEAMDDGFVSDQNGLFIGSWDASTDLELLGDVGVEAVRTFQYDFNMFFPPEELMDSDGEAWNKSKL